MSLKGTVPVNKGQRSTHCICGLPRTPENTNKAGYCKVCAKVGSERYKRKHPHADRGKHYFRKYGVTKEEFNNRKKKQKERCKICKVRMRYSNRITRPNLDHAHGSKKFRGVLCHLCNTGLGLFRDNAKFLQSAIKYLKETQ